MPTVTFTETERTFSVKGPEELPRIIRKVAASQKYPEAMGMTVTGPGAREVLDRYDTGFPCQTKIYLFEDQPYEGLSVNGFPDYVFIRLKKRRREEDTMPEGPVYAMGC